MEVKIWLKEQRIKSAVFKVAEDCRERFRTQESTSHSTKVLYETDLCSAEGIDMLYRVVESFLNGNNFNADKLYTMTVIDNGTFFSFELELNRHTEVYNAVVELSEYEW